MSRLTPESRARATHETALNTEADDLLQVIVSGPFCSSWEECAIDPLSPGTPISKVSSRSAAYHVQRHPATPPEGTRDSVWQSEKDQQPAIDECWQPDACVDRCERREPKGGANMTLGVEQVLQGELSTQGVWMIPEAILVCLM